MKTRPVRCLAAISTLFLLSHCGETPPLAESAPETPTPPAVETPEAPAPEVPTAEAAAALDSAMAATEGETTAADIFNAPPPPPPDLGGFGSDDPVAREDRPDRGVLRFDDSMHLRNAMPHWEQFDWTAFTAKRPGRYHVEVTYTLQRATLPVQFRFGEQRLKKPLTAASAAKTALLGEIYIETPGDHPFSLYAPTTVETAKVEVLELLLVPAPENPTPPEASADGSLTFHARMATTWSEVMRYEPAPEKNCLGYWTEPDDFAEWAFTATKPGRYEVIVTQGCGEGQGGSRVAVRVGDSETEFVVKDTGGFQTWEDVSAGIIEVRESGQKHLVIDPIDKAGKAVMDLQKIVLKPVS